MAPSMSLWFLSFRFDLDNQSLWNGAHETVLKPKTFALLALLVEHAGRLVTKQEILTAVWPGVTVNEEVVTARIKELRQLLGDERKTPQFIQTVHGRGYRFLPAITTTPSVPRSKFQVPSSPPFAAFDSAAKSTAIPQPGTWNLKLCWWAVKLNSPNFTSGGKRR